MIRTLAAIFVVILLSCELGNTVNSFLSTTGCCKMICMKTDACGDDDMNNCSSKGCILMKTCVDCCYVIPDKIFTPETSSLKIFYSKDVTSIVTSYINECFHPPEVI